MKLREIYQLRFDWHWSAHKNGHYSKFIGHRTMCATELIIDG